MYAKPRRRGNKNKLPESSFSFPKRRFPLPHPTEAFFILIVSFCFIRFLVPTIVPPFLYMFCCASYSLIHPSYYRCPFLYMLSFLLPHVEGSSAPHPQSPSFPTRTSRLGKGLGRATGLRCTRTRSAKNAQDTGTRGEMEAPLTPRLWSSDCSHEEETRKESRGR